MATDDLQLTLAIWTPALIGAAFVFLFGACVGSFLNVLVWRLPTGQSVVSPPSRCPTCGHRLSWRENLPILGWMLLRGRCAACRTRISVQYPLVEVLVALLFTAAFVAFYAPLDRTPSGAFHDAASPWWHLQGFSGSWPAFTVVVLAMAGLVAMLLVDARTMLIPIDIPIATTLIAFSGWLVQGFLPESRALRGFVPLPVASWTVTFACVGMLAGLGLSRWLVATGRLRTSFSDYDEYVKEGDDGANYPHARREMLAEMAFLLPGVAGAGIACVLAALLGFTSDEAVCQPMTLLGGSLLGAIVGGGTIWTIRILGTLGFGREAMGLGDVYLQAAVGAAFGWRVAVLAVFVAVFLSLAWALAMKLLGRFGRFFGYRQIPFGPFLAAGAIAFVVARGPVVAAFDLFGRSVLRANEALGFAPPEADVRSGGSAGRPAAGARIRERAPTARLAEPRDER